MVKVDEGLRRHGSFCAKTAEFKPRSLSLSIGVGVLGELLFDI